MTEQASPQNERDLVDALVELFNEVEPDTPEEIDAILREAGHDPDEITSRIKAAAEQALADSPLNWRNKAHHEMEVEQAKFAQLKSSVPPNRPAVLAAIEELLSTLHSKPGMLAMTHHRNLEEATDEDLLSLLTELEYLAAHPDNQSDTSRD